MSETTKKVGIGVALITIACINPCRKLVLPFSITLDSEDLQLLVSTEVTLTPGDIVRVPFNFISRLPPTHFRLFVPRDQRQKEESTFRQR